ncbi:cytochrome P450 [Streptomyces stackebrandtii]|uniref:cytochrome P450 n=1 Tax=Streptomyces stackebrandtii TaxID=3051177 RepID=UPI0028DC3C2E|nr:cytochrome P450 [Streptomyces sp. DSM 40976]
MTSPTEHHGPVVHDRAAAPLPDTVFDPLPHRLLREEPVARVRLRYGEGDAWLVTRYEDVKQIASDPRLSRALAVGRPVTSMTPHDLARHRTEHPGGDLVSELAAARATGGISTPELVSMSVMLTLNGLDAVRNIVATMVYVLLGHPEQTAKLRAEPDRLPRAVDELLRYIPQRNGVGMPRIATADIEVGGVTIREGEAVYVFYPAANRDPSVYTEPDRLDLDRNEAPHLAFGHGAHYCAGAQLARMEAEVMLSTLLTRFPELATAVEPERIAWRRGTVNRGPVSLPVTW